MLPYLAGLVNGYGQPEAAPLYGNLPEPWSRWHEPRSSSGNSMFLRSEFSLNDQSHRSLVRGIRGPDQVLTTTTRTKLGEGKGDRRADLR